jgi:hypothetical protein
MRAMLRTGLLCNNHQAFQSEKNLFHVINNGNSSQHTKNIITYRTC